MCDDPSHDVLPWLLTDTLEPGEAHGPLRQLDDCPGCREDMEFLSRIAAAARSYGGALFSSHPTAESLGALVDGKLEESDARELRAHLALCMTCAAEARWLAGDAAAGDRAIRDHGG